MTRYVKTRKAPHFIKNAQAKACATSTRFAGDGPIKASGPYSEQMRFMR
jgi:hypothetical protein